VRIAPALVQVFPAFPRAVARHVLDAHRHVDEAGRLDGPEQRARGAIEPAAGRRAGDDLDLPLRPPGHAQNRIDRIDRIKTKLK
jgi:hypothetical protein